MAKQFLKLSFSKRYPLFIIVTISSCCIAVIIVTINLISSMYTTSVDYSKQLSIQHIESMSMVLHKLISETIAKPDTMHDTNTILDKKKLSQLVEQINAIATFYIAKPTDNDRNYIVVETIKASPLQSKIITDHSANFIMRKGLLRVTVNPSIKDDPYSYIESYMPLKYNNKNYIIIIHWLVPHISILQNKHAADLRSLIQIIAIIILATVFIITFLSIIHFMRTRSLLQELSHSIQSIANGNMDMMLNDSIDSDLKTIAVSFNSLAQEFKNKDEALKKIKEETFTDIFKQGVQRLKENQFDEAIACFITVTIFKPNSFASYFNLGVCCVKKGELNKSVEYFTQAQEINPDNQLTMRYIEKIRGLQ
ncbi:MAG: tetratricopeptide repeat protein [Spirochaetes bacterium]|nr:tetratricopeptide repeat protein [Spirochaetota bacterium]